MSRLADLRRRAAHQALGMLPTPLASAIGGRLGQLVLPRVYAGAVARGAANIARLRPELDAAQRQAMLRDAMGHLGRTMAELSRLDRIVAEGRLETVGEDYLRLPLQSGQSVIVPLLHMGNWEPLTLAAARFGVPFHVIYQPPASDSEHQLLRDARLPTGVRLLRPGMATTMETLAALRRGGELMGIFADAQMADRRIAGPAFGRPLPRRGNMANIVRMAVMTGALVVPAMTERLSGTRFRVTILPPVAVPDADQGLRNLNQVLEDWIRPRLEQWFMLFRLGMGE